MEHLVNCRFVSCWGNQWSNILRTLRLRSIVFPWHGSLLQTLPRASMDSPFLRESGRERRRAGPGMFWHPSCSATFSEGGGRFIRNMRSRQGWPQPQISQPYSPAGIYNLQLVTGCVTDTRMYSYTPSPQSPFPSPNLFCLTGRDERNEVDSLGQAPVS